MLALPAEFTPDFMARLENLRLKTRREYAGMGKGVHLSPRRGTSLEFNDFRPYSLGDDFRYIDWGLYGRTDKLYIKLFKEEEDLLTYIFVDASASMGYPAGDRKFSSAIAIALALAYVALSSGDRVMIRVLAGEGESSLPSFVKDRFRIVDLARRLSTIRPAGQLDLASTLAREMVAIRRAGKVFVISDYLMLLNSVTRGLSLFSAANMDVTVVQVLGGGELGGQGLDGDVRFGGLGKRRASAGRAGPARARALQADAAAAIARDSRLRFQERPALHALYHRPELSRVFPARRERARIGALATA